MCEKIINGSTEPCSETISINKSEDYTIGVVGQKTTYGNGAIRCIKEKGRFDLIANGHVLHRINNAIRDIVHDNKMIDKLNIQDLKNSLFDPFMIYDSAFSLNNNIKDKTVIKVCCHSIVRLSVYKYYFNNANSHKYFLTNSETDETVGDELLSIMQKSVLLMLMDLSIHFQKGAEIYGERNCEKGLPKWTFHDSGLRHLTQCIIGIDDGEDHFISAIWNFWMLCAYTLLDEMSVSE